MTGTATPEVTDISIVNVGDGMTLFHPYDRLPYVVTWRSKSGKTVRVKPLRQVSLDTGHEPSHFDGLFPVWNHTYTEQERAELVIAEAPERTVRFTKGGYWTSYGADFAAGGALYFRNYSY